ncbi:YcxB family protein [Clostridium cavendishii]|uniref:YcxB family protein n=1 Tax=Clostridium cavendishii TaxID=349931 RepID=UPI000935430E|nr:YcxB family protein [Clostridium cavendishii]
MKISYQNTLQEMAEFNLFTLQNSPNSKKKFKIRLFIIPLFTIASSIYMYFTFASTPIEFISASLSFGIMWLILYPKMYRFQIKQLFSKIATESKKDLIPITLTLTSDSILKETAVSSYKTSWSYITSVNVLKNIIIIYLNYNTALLVPIKVFRTPTEKKKFLDYVYQNIDINKK